MVKLRRTTFSRWISVLALTLVLPTLCQASESRVCSSAFNGEVQTLESVYRQIDASYGPWDDVDGRPTKNAFIKDAMMRFYEKLKKKRNSDSTVNLLDQAQLTEILNSPHPENLSNRRSSDAVSERQLAAIFLSHLKGVVPAGKDYSLSRLQWEAQLLGQTVSLHANLFRYDLRSPAVIREANGFHRNPRSLPYTLWEHVFHTVQSGSLVSLTALEDAAGVRSMVAGYMSSKPKPSKIDLSGIFASVISHVKNTSLAADDIPLNPVVVAPEAKTTVTVYQYRLRDVVGVRTPSEYGIESEAEVVTSSVALEQIDQYRELQVEQLTGDLVSESGWLKF